MQVPIDFVPQSGSVQAASAGTVSFAAPGEAVHDQFDHILDELFQLLAATNAPATPDVPDDVVKIICTPPETPPVKSQPEITASPQVSSHLINLPPQLEAHVAPPDLLRNLRAANVALPAGLSEDCVAGSNAERLETFIDGSSSSDWELPLTPVPAADDSIDTIPPASDDLRPGSESERLLLPPTEPAMVSDLDHITEGYQHEKPKSDNEQRQSGSPPQHVDNVIHYQPASTAPSLSQFAVADQLVNGQPSEPMPMVSLPAYVTGLTPQVREGTVQQVVLRLDPPELGSITVRVRRDHDALHIDWSADSSEVKGLLQQEEHRLLDRLVKSGENSSIEFTYREGEQRQQPAELEYDFSPRLQRPQKFGGWQSEQLPDTPHNLSFVA